MPFNLRTPAAGAGGSQLRKFRNRHATHCSPMQRRGTIAPKAKAPVRKNTFSEAVAAPTDKRGFVMPKFWGRCACTCLPWFRAG